jgi:ribose transport system permease protein
MTAAALPVPVAIIGGMVVGATVGLVNGLIVVKLRIPAFIRRSACCSSARADQVVTNGYPVHPLPVVGDVGSARPFSVSAELVFIVAGVAGDPVLSTVLGRNMLRLAAIPKSRLVGINTSSTRSAPSC